MSWTYPQKNPQEKQRPGFDHSESKFKISPQNGSLRQLTLLKCLLLVLRAYAAKATAHFRHPHSLAEFMWAGHCALLQPTLTEHLLCARHSARPEG